MLKIGVGIAVASAALLLLVFVFGSGSGPGAVSPPIIRPTRFSHVAYGRSISVAKLASEHRQEHLAKISTTRHRVRKEHLPPLRLTP